MTKVDNFEIKIAPERPKIDEEYIEKIWSLGGEIFLK